MTIISYNNFLNGVPHPEPGAAPPENRLIGLHRESIGAFCQKVYKTHKEITVFPGEGNVS